MILAAARPARAQTPFDLVHRFPLAQSSLCCNPVIQAADGNLYGTAGGGTFGAGIAFKISPGGTVTILHDFTSSGSDGGYPTSALIQASDGNFYGTTMFGGSSNDGTIFKMTPGGAVTVLHSFDARVDGFIVIDPVIQGADGNLYGSAEEGGPGGPSGSAGTLFRISFDGAFSLLHVFDAGDPAGGFPG
ncbi:MAG TPA: choice-of-anchor tandem repeat GloVer-containing protein, partial [Vicinamibacterales bacterium]|nr:choice-of-anchor tandem repeat GloVer-containing protein [Vicinamibacterales bacterium]